MTQIENSPALTVNFADFTSHTDIWSMIDACRKHINAAEGIDPTSALLEIRIPYNYPVPSFFDGLGNSFLVSRHNYQFVACLGTFNWGIIFGNANDAQQYMANPIIDRFAIGQTEPSNPPATVWDERPSLFPGMIEHHWCRFCKRRAEVTTGRTCRDCGNTKSDPIIECERLYDIIQKIGQLVNAW